MSLQLRIQNPAADQETAIPIHVFTAAFSLWVRGSIDAARLQAAFNLDAGEVIQVQSLKTVYDAATAAGKVDFLLKLESAGVMFEQGIISAAEYASIMGL